MTPSAPFTLHTATARWALTSESDGLHTILRLSRDDAPAAEQRPLDGTATLQAANLVVAVKLKTLGGIDWAYAIPPHADPQQAPHIGREFAAPPGSFAARQQAWGSATRSCTPAATWWWPSLRCSAAFLASAPSWLGCCHTSTSCCRASRGQT